MTDKELIAEAWEALARINIHAFPDDLAFQYRGGVLGRNITEILRDVTSALGASIGERDAATAELEAQLTNAKAGWDSALRIVNEGNEIIKQVGAERDAAVAAIERVRAIAERHGVKSRTEEIFAALDGAPEPERLSIPIPNVPFGPEGVAPNIATASYLIEVVKKLDFGYVNVGGSNVTATLRKILVDTAEALRTLPVEGESKP